MLGSMNPNFNPSNMVVPGIGGQGAFGPSGKAPSYMTTTNANMTGTQAAAPNSSQGSFLSSMFGQMGGGSTPQPQGIAGLQAQPLDPQQQLQQQQFASQMKQQLQQQQPQQQQMQGMQTSQPQSNRRAYDPVGMQRGQQGNLMQQQGGQQFAPSPRDQMSDRDRFMEGQFQGNQDMPQAQIDAMRSQFGNTFDAQGRNPRPPKAEGLGVSNFVGASSNDMQRMLNRGSISGDNMGDVRRQMEQLRSNEFLAKMRAQNPERFNNPSPPLPLAGMPQQMPPPLAGGAPQYHGQFVQSGNVPPGVDPGTLPRPPNPFFTDLSEYAPPSSLPGLGGIMGQAPPSMQRNIPLMQNQMQNQQPPNYGPQQMSAFGQGASNYSGSIGNPRMSPFQQMSPSGFSMMQPSTGSQNSAPIQSPFA